MTNIRYGQTECSKHVGKWKFVAPGTIQIPVSRSSQFQILRGGELVITSTVYIISISLFTANVSILLCNCGQLRLQLFVKMLYFSFQFTVFLFWVTVFLFLVNCISLFSQLYFSFQSTVFLFLVNCISPSVNCKSVNRCTIVANVAAAVSQKVVFLF